MFRNSFAPLVSAVVVVLFGALLVLASSASGATITDSTLSLSVPKAWSGFGGGGIRLTVAGRRHVGDEVVVANYALPHSPAWSRGALAVPPPSRLLISLFSFPANGASLYWPAQDHLQITKPVGGAQEMIQQVRFNGHAVLIRVLYGSRPTSAQVALAERVLRSITASG